MIGINKIKRFLATFAVPGLMNYLCFGMALMYVADLFTDGGITALFGFSRALILSGQIWRVLTFTCLPINSQPFWVLITVILYFQIGRELESAWGAHELTKYLLVSWLLTVAAGFIAGHVTNTYIFLGMFLAYGKILPKMQMRIFFMIPVEAWLLAVMDAVIMLISLIRFHDWAVIPAFLTFAIFFGKDFFDRWNSRRRYNKFKEAFRHRNDE